MSINIGKKVVFVAAIAGAAIIGGATTAIVAAAIPSSDTGQIHGCYRTTGNLINQAGALRVVDTQAGQACSAQETSLAWNQQGPKGDQGEPGPQGPQGPAGSSQPYAVGNQMTVNWGDIPEGGTPQKFLTIPGFGDIYFTRCDSNGVFEVEFRNTSGEPVHIGNDPDGHVMQPGEIINSGEPWNNWYNYSSTGLLAKGSGSTMQMAHNSQNYATSDDSHTCFQTSLVTLSYGN